MEGRSYCSQSLGKSGYPEGIDLDPALQSLHSPLTPAQVDQCRALFQSSGCTEALLVWCNRQRAVLLVGYEVFPLLRTMNIEFPIQEVLLRDHNAAWWYTLRTLLLRKSVTRLEASYLRGQRYVDEKLPPGVNRDPHALLGKKTADALGEIFLDGRTIRRDAALKAAVDRMSARWGQHVKPLLLGVKSRLSHEAIMALG